MDPKELISAIRVILKQDWDPLNEEGAFKVPDSLDSYIGPVMKLLAQHPSVEQISKLLEEIEIKDFAGINNRENLLKAASKLKALSEQK